MLDQVQKVFIEGIKGVAMANLAIILTKMGKSVTGSDTNEEFITDEILSDIGVSYTVGFEPADLPKDIDLVIYSAAHRGHNNPQIIEAKNRKITVLHQAELIDEIMQKFPNRLAICGSHGKTTTSSLLAHALIKLDQNPSYMVGTSRFGKAWGGDYHSQAKHFVVEADEYAIDPPGDKTPKFSKLNPNIVLATNIDLDHPDVYDTIGEVEEAFRRFLQGRQVIYCQDDENLVSCAKKFHLRGGTFGFREDSMLRVSDVNTTGDYTTFHAIYKQKDLGQFKIALFGKKNVSNAAGVILLLLNLGFTVAEIKGAISGFSGAKRRIEQIAHENDIYLFDSYAHHPAEIIADVGALRDRFPSGRIIVVFQPHTYSRTQALLEDFAQALQRPDISLIAPIFASAREKGKRHSVSSQDIASSARSPRVAAFEESSKLIEHLGSIIKRGDVIFTMGAGDVYKMKDDIIEQIRKL